MGIFKDEFGAKKLPLTQEKIKKDLKKVAISRLIPFIILVILLSFICFGTVFITVSVISSPFLEDKFALPTILGLALQVIWLLVFAGIYFAKTHPYIVALKKPIVIVTDVLTGDSVTSKMEVDYDYTRLRTERRKHHDMCFKCYGEYTVPSTTFSDNLTGVSFSSLGSGDECYLVLTHEHSGKILLVYPTKTYELL